MPAEHLLDKSAAELGLDSCLAGEPARTIEMSFPGKTSRWGLRRSAFREGGLPHQLVVLSDLSQALREEERQAWQRLIRVLGHELNNSLAPIQSVAQSLESLLSRGMSAAASASPGEATVVEGAADPWDDMKRGLRVIRTRAEALGRFMNAYARLARLPQPQLKPLEVGPWIRRVAGLETRLAVRLAAGPELSISADGDQLEQLLINLVRNAVDAAMETGGGVELGWRKNSHFLEVWVSDEGPGLPNTSNLFVPFFTTKPGGSGIGLVLSRQIAEAHGGSLSLENRVNAHGCTALLRLPLGPHSSL